MGAVQEVVETAGVVQEVMETVGVGGGDTGRGGDRGR